MTIPPRSPEPSDDRPGRSIERQFDTICRTLLRGPAVETTPQFCRVRTGAMHPFGNFAIITDPAHLEGAIAPLLCIDAPAAAIFLGQPPAHVSSSLAAHGFGLAETMPAMAVDIDRLGSASMPSGYSLGQIDPEGDRDAWIGAFAVGYEIPTVVAELFGPSIETIQGPDHHAHYFAIRKNGRIVSTSMLFLHGGLAGIYCVSTTPDERGKGLGAAATAAPLRFAGDLGYRTGILQSSAMGESIYRRLGFEQHGSLPIFVRMSGQG